MGFVTVTAPQAASAPAVNPPNVDKEPIVEVERRDADHAAANDLGGKRGAGCDWGDLEIRVKFRLDPWRK